MCDTDKQVWKSSTTQQHSENGGYWTKVFKPNSTEVFNETTPFFSDVTTDTTSVETIAMTTSVTGGGTSGETIGAGLMLMGLCIGGICGLGLLVSSTLFVGCNFVQHSFTFDL